MTNAYINPFILKRININKKKNFFGIFERIDTNNYFLINNVIKEKKYKVLNYLEDRIDREHNNILLDVVRAMKKENLKQIIKNYNKYREDNESLDMVEDFIKLLEQKEKEISEIKEEYFVKIDNTRNNIQSFLNVFEYLKVNLLFVNPLIFDNLNSYLITPAKKFNKKHRKTEITIYNYLARSLFKTSPFGLLTSVTRLGAQSEDIKLSTTINHTFILKYLNKVLHQSSIFIKKAYYTHPPASYYQKDNEYYIDFISLEGTTEQKKMMISKEISKKMKLPKRIYYFLKDRELDEFFQYEDISMILGNEISEPKKVQLFKKFINIGLFIPAIYFNENSNEKFLNDVFNKSSNLLDYQDSNYFNRTLRQICNLIISFEKVNNLFEGRNILEHLNRILKEINQKYALNFTVKDVFYLDSYFFDDNHLETNKELITTDLMTRLEKLQLFNLIFDASLRLRLELNSTMNKKTHKSLIQFDDFFFEVLFQVSKKIVPYWEDFKYVSHNPQSLEVAVLDDLKLKFIKELSQYVTKYEMSPSLNIEPLLDKFIKDIPDSIKKINKCSTFFVQKNKGDIILNACYEGNEKYSTRFMNYYKAFLENNKEYLSFKDNHFNKKNYYELNETLGFNGNVKDILLENQCYTVGVGAQRFNFKNIKNQKLLKVEKLFFNNSSDYNNLLVDEEGSNVQICLRGSLTPALMPGYISTLLQTFSIGGMYYRFPEIIKNKVIPRLSIGNVILSRKRIRLSFLVDKLRDVVTSNNKVDQFILLNEIFNNENIPSEIFILIDKNTHYIEDSYSKLKPMYFNINSPFSAEQLIKKITQFINNGQEDGIFIEEYLSNDSNRAEEVQFELYS